MDRKYISILTIVMLCVAMISVALAGDGPWTCPNCGHEGNEDNFCPFCGESRPAINWTCPNCGHEGNEDNFCPFCGEPCPEAQVATTSEPADTHVPVTDGNALSKGIAAYDAEDWETAMEYLRPLADRGDAEAQWRVGIMYDYAHGVEESEEKAIKYYFLSAEQDNPEGLLRLGDKYQSGHGVEQSYEMAADYYRRAAKLGNMHGQFRLGILYQHGHGVEQSFEMAAEYYKRAADQGSEIAAKHLQELIDEGKISVVPGLD